MAELPTTAAHAGKLVRMGRIFGPDGRCMIVPLDHGTVLGRVPGLEDPLALLRTLLASEADGFLIGLGLMRRSAPMFARRGAPARLLTLDQHWSDAEGAGHDLAADLTAAAALGADGVKLLMPWDVASSERSRTASLIASVIAEADPLGLPVMVEPVAATVPPGSEAVSIVAHGCRVAAELGADIIKLAHPEDDDILAAWVEESGVPLVLLGGPGASTPDELLGMVKHAMQAGASGIVIGRKVWQRPVPEALELVSRLCEVVHS